MDAHEPAASRGAATRELTFLSLPSEVQKDIVAQCSQSDLICLSLVSKHFRDLAAAQLYRNFHIVFPDEDDPAYDSPIDGLAGGLDTFVTSDYDYARHLRDMSLDTLSAGDKAETAYKPYLFNVSCGKFMNTLLLMTLRKSKSLETFKWNIRVELSRPVYKALHAIETLKDVHIRLQVGPSMYEPPPPLPYSASLSSSPTQSHAPLTDVGPSAPPTMSVFGVPPPPPPLFVNSMPVTFMPGPPPAAPKSTLRPKTRRCPLSKEPPTLSGFKKLRSLAVLDMDTLDAVPEIRTCIRNSSSTLTRLKLSFSDHLASQARKPPPEAELDDSDPDDEFQVMPGPPHPAPYADSSLSIPARTYRAAEERKSQEAVLGRIFDVESLLAKKPPKRASSKENETAKETEEAGETREDANADNTKEFFDFLNKISSVTRKLNDLKSEDSGGNSEAGAATKQEILDMVVTAAKNYVASVEAKPKPAGNCLSAAASLRAPEPGGAGESALETAQSPAEGSSSKTALTAVEGSSQDPSNAPKPRATTGATKNGGPEDISVEEPEEQLNLDGQDSSSTPTPAETPTPSCDDQDAGEGADDAPPHGDKEIAETSEQKDQNDLEGAKDVGTGKQVSVAQLDESSAGQRDSGHISEYIRATRGIGLESLSIYLIPVKASVLSKAIDLRALRQLTLLNVGPQQPIWVLLSKENKLHPLPLRKIFTDNVSPALLNFVSQLEELHDFLILERDHKYKPESFAVKTGTTIELIRRLVLRKHLPTLRRLMIKNMDSTDWDVDEQTIKLICRKGKMLEELAVSMNIHTIHTFMQNMAGLVNLHALHIIQLRNDDTCVWVMRETKKFLIDNLSHHQNMKLEWVAIDDDDRLEKIVRITDEPRKQKKSKGKGKEKASGSGAIFPSSAHGTGFGSHYSDTFPFLPAEGWADAAGGSCSEEDSDDYDDDDDDDGTKPPKFRLETIEGVHFYDVWGVRIFKKEVVSGRL